jgi:hypothetical protein
MKVEEEKVGRMHYIHTTATVKTERALVHVSVDELGAWNEYIRLNCRSKSVILKSSKHES